jgi:plastocyanin
MRQIITIVIILLMIVSLGCMGETKTVETGDESSGEMFGTPKKSAHYESNTPAHGSTVPWVPINVVIDVNFDLRPPSSISIIKDGNEYGVGETVIDSNGLAMRVRMDPNSPNGVYTVVYDACWPDGSCHDGKFQFAIDTSKKESYTDLTGENQVAIDIMDFSFKPQSIRINKGTRVTWENQDSVEHFVNTDSHPAHTYYPDQNSRGLKKGDTYSVVFNEAGIYPYHCSAHASTMTAFILVE